MKKLVIAAAATLVVAALVIWRVEAASTQILDKRYPVPANPLTVAVAGSNVKLGEHLAHLDGCFNCHGDALTGRIAFRGIFGTILTAPNLTRHIREHSDAQLATMIRYGIDEDGTTMIGMPSGNFIKNSDSDIAAIIAYLRSLPEKPDAAPKTQWRFGGRFMLATGLFPPEATLVDRTTRGPRVTPTEQVALGRYLAKSQCTICHGRDLSGDADLHSADLRKLIPHYNPRTLRRLLTTGKGLPDHDTALMKSIAHSRLHYLTPAETAALYAYLKGLARHGQE